MAKKRNNYISVGEQKDSLNRELSFGSSANEEKEIWINPKESVQVIGIGKIRKCSVCGKINIMGVIPKPDKKWKPSDEICFECLKQYEVVE